MAACLEKAKASLVEMQAMGGKFTPLKISESLTPYSRVLEKLTTLPRNYSPFMETECLLQH
jgi:hypothetical protein